MDEDAAVDTKHLAHLARVPLRLVWRAAVCGLRLLCHPSGAWLQMPPLWLARVCLALQVHVLVSAEHCATVSDESWTEGVLRWPARLRESRLAAFRRACLEALVALDGDVLLGVPDPFLWATGSAEVVELEEAWARCLDLSRQPAVRWLLGLPEAEVAQRLRLPFDEFFLTAPRAPPTVPPTWVWRPASIAPEAFAYAWPAAVPPAPPPGPIRVRRIAAPPPLKRRRDDARTPQSGDD